MTLTVNFNSSLISGYDMKKQKTCIDCLHCKVSASSTQNRRWCFCAVAGKRENQKEAFWHTKPLCEKFDDMGGRSAVVIIPAVALNRRPLLGNRLYV
jgi:hypothetical protein